MQDACRRGADWADEFPGYAPEVGRFRPRTTRSRLLASAAAMDDEIRLFVYGSLLGGERDHALLASAEPLGKARTEAAYTLIDLGVYAALVEGGKVAIAGELYRIDRKLRFALDVKRECPILFQRIKIRLEDGTQAEAYAMREEQVRGKRRLSHGDFRRRFAPRPVPEHARSSWSLGRSRSR